MGSGDSSKNAGSRRRRRSSSSNLKNHRSSKKQNVRVTGVEETLDDRISQLPNSLLVQILSLLPTTKDAFTTCILSKRWQYLWTSVYNFNFSSAREGVYKCNFSPGSKDDDFISFVDYVLDHSISSNIKKIELDCTNMDHSEYNSHIRQWLHTAAERKVEHVVVTSENANKAFTLPESFCSCSSLISLDLSSCYFDADVLIAWKSLKSIRLDFLVLSDDDIVNLLSGCPVLETLEFYYVSGFHCLDIKSLKLKKLYLTGFCHIHRGNDDSLEIFAPNLQHLEISGDLSNLKCRLVDVSSVVNAKLTFKIRYNYHDYQVLRTLVQNYLQKLSCTTELTIRTWFTEVVFMLQLEGVMLPELRWKCLTVELLRSEYNLYGIVSLLQISPLLESFNIHIEDEDFTNPACQLEKSYFAQVDNINLPGWNLNTVFPNLKNVKIVCCGRGCLNAWSEGGFNKLFELSKFLLKNAVALQKFVIVAKRRKCWNCPQSCVSRHLSQLAKKLLDSPGSSTNFEIIYHEIA